MTGGLLYVDDSTPGISRRRAGTNFVYLDARGKTIRSKAEIARIRALAVPPAYEDVWICPQPNGHIQATARDARGRKQYRYHRRWREVRDEVKFRHTVSFAKALSALRGRVAKDLATAGLSREKVLATVARLLDTTLIRVGNESYARENGSFGLTTLRVRHVKREHGALRLRFRGKSGVEHLVKVGDRRVASVIRRCCDLPGQDLFAYESDDGNVVPVRSGDVNDYVREAMAGDFTAKDFRTWHATVLAASALSQAPAAETTAERKRTVSDAVKSVANALRNTPAVARSSYIHPAVLDEVLEEGSLTLPRVRSSARTDAQLSTLERRVLRLLERAGRRDERKTLARKLRASVRAAKGGGFRPAASG